MNRRTALALAAATGLAGLTACAPMGGQPDIVDIAASNEQTFGTLVAAVEAAGLVETLK
ncbi:MAG: fasciclin domain-containing protein, partial [Deinococcus-Thermus bacterium]|nr:fasciclin domain-containing protein [Deinococcota bacterium]